ncbi:hypothetical protein DSECCO2_499050 [anaerobic digester metagenome]
MMPSVSVAATYIVTELFKSIVSPDEGAVILQLGIPGTRELSAALAFTMPYPVYLSHPVPPSMVISVQVETKA